MESLFFDHALLDEGWASAVRITLDHGRIASVECDAVPAADDERGRIAIPGMPNLHSHAFQRGMAGLSERRSQPQDSFWSWRQIMYRFLDRMTPEDVEAIAALAYVEMLEGGFTRVGEFHYLHHAPDGLPYADPAELSTRIAAAAQSTGIRLTLLPCFYAQGDFGALPPLPGQKRFLHGIDAFAGLLSRCETLCAALPGASLGVAPHSLRAVAPEALASLVEMAAGRPIHIHAAEQLREVEGCLAWSGLRPVEWLLENAPLDARWCLIHATHMTGEEAARLARTGAVAGLCPITESSLGDGIFPGPDWRLAGGRLGIGTDSNIAIGAANELCQLEYSQRLKRMQRNVMADGLGASTGESLFSAAASGGAAALGAPHPRLSAGMPADIVGLDAETERFAASSDLDRLDCWIFGSGGRAIRDVWVDGAHVVREGRHRNSDAIRSQFRNKVRALASA